VAPVPWFPFGGARFGRYADLASIPSQEIRFGIRVLHPRFPVVPKVGMNLAPHLLFRFVRPMISRMVMKGARCDLIDAHYFYPDGVAAIMLGKALNKPVVVTARGSDLNIISHFRRPRGMIKWAAHNAQGLVTVCQALKEELIKLDVERDSVQVFRNGVDLELFRPLDRSTVQNQLGVKSPVLLSVGNLISLKGHDLVIRALSLISGAVLMIVGKGPDERSLRGLVTALGLEQRVLFLGPIQHERMPEIYNAADVLILASEREGWANVLLEAMACGTPVAATDVSGTPEVVTSEVAGVLFRERTPLGIANAVSRVLTNPPHRGATRAYAERFSWSETTAGQLRLFRRVLSDWSKSQ